MGRLVLVFGMLFLFGPAAAVAGPKIAFGDSGELEFTLSTQFWGVYTLGQKTDPEGKAEFAPVDDRLDLLIRRGRLGFGGRFFTGLAYQLVLSFDGVGRSPHDALRGGLNPDERLSVLDAYFVWSAHPDLALVTFGFFRPQVGRESMASSFVISSFDEPAAGAYLRRHLVGRASGREAGVNVGGQKNGDGLGLRYDVGLFDPTHADNLGPEAKRWSPIVVARLALWLGDPEEKAYGLANREVFFRERTGVTVGLNGAWQGRTDLFDDNALAGVDLLGSVGGFNLGAELDFLARRTSGASVVNRQWLVRASYMFRLPREQFLEPVVQYFDFTGDRNAALNGRDRLAEATLNWYVNRLKLRVNLAYGHNAGRARSDYSDGRTFVRGDYVATGLQLML